MEQIAEQITQELLQELPDQVQFFTPDELLSTGIPYIVVETLRKNIASTIDSELNMPESEWIQHTDEDVQLAWQNFVDISRKNLRIPAPKLSYMLGEAVEQCLELALKPRRAVVDIMFRTRDTIDFETAKQRVEWMQVNKELGLALLRYMEKKEKDEITIDQARDLIQKVDKRLTENYHPLNWAQVLKPVFDLAGPSVNTELFRIFFDDKDKATYARKFSKLERELNETEFIEALSSAELLDIDEQQDDQPELFVPVEEESEPEEVVEIEQSEHEQNVIKAEESEHEDEPEPGQQERLKERPEDFEEPREEPVERVQPEEKTEEIDDESTKANYTDETQEEDQQQENIVDLFSEIREDDLFEEEKDEHMLTLVEDEDESEEDNISLLSKFMFDVSEEDSKTEGQDHNEDLKSSENKEPSSIYEEMNLVKDDLTDIEKKRDFFQDSSKESEEEEEEELSFKIEDREEEIEIEEEESIDEEVVVEDSDEEDQPMWRSFLERNDLETESGYEYDKDSEEELADEFEEEADDGFIEEPIYDLTADEQDPDEKIKKISGWLDDDKERFVDEIFRGSEVAYEQSLLEIMDYENWKSASMYLEREVFSRNKIDVYDEAAVDFTDRLHSFFLENNSKQEDRE